jgi:hypothetical protein
MCRSLDYSERLQESEGEQQQDWAIRSRKSKEILQKPQKRKEKHGMAQLKSQQERQKRLPRGGMASPAPQGKRGTLCSHSFIPNSTLVLSSLCWLYLFHQV